MNDVDNIFLFGARARVVVSFGTPVLPVPLQVLQKVHPVKQKSCTGSLCAHMHGSVLPVPVLCLGILPMVRDKSISFGRLWVAINKSEGFGRLWVAIDLHVLDLVVRVVATYM